MDADGRLVERLDSIAQRYDPSNPSEHFDHWLKRLEVGAARPWLLGRHGVELGCATGELTSLMRPWFDRYDVIEGSLANIERTRARVADVRFFESLWERHQPDGLYSDVLLFGALEHAEDDLGVLESVRSWLEPGGRLHISVPNGRSLHRYVGIELGVLPTPEYLTEDDRSQGHERNYSVDTLTAAVRATGYRILHWEPIFLKLLPNRRMLDWDWEYIQAVHRVSRLVPEHGAEIYLAATLA